MKSGILQALQCGILCLAASLVVLSSLAIVYTDASEKQPKTTKQNKQLRVIQSTEFSRRDSRDHSKLWTLRHDNGGVEMNDRQRVAVPVVWQNGPELALGTEKNSHELQSRQMIAPGYYEAECSKAKNPCKEGKYCNLLYCEDCHKNKMACSTKEQCCKGLQCVYGRCDKSSPGEAGTFCEKDSDCKNGCCILEPTINSVAPLCKPKLAEYHQCADVLYRKIWIGDKPDCGPCQDGLECTQKGFLGSHEVCMKPIK